MMDVEENHPLIRPVRVAEANGPQSSNLLWNILVSAYERMSHGRGGTNEETTSLCKLVLELLSCLLRGAQKVLRCLSESVGSFMSNVHYTHPSKNLIGFVWKVLISTFILNHYLSWKQKILLEGKWETRFIPIIDILVIGGVLMINFLTNTATLDRLYDSIKENRDSIKENRDSIEKGQESINNSVKTCQDSVKGCRDAITECQDLVKTCQDSVKGCRDAITECQDLVNTCQDSVEGCRDAVTECQDLVKKCEDSIRESKILMLAQFHPDLSLEQLEEKLASEEQRLRLGIHRRK